MRGRVLAVVIVAHASLQVGAAQTTFRATTHLIVQPVSVKDKKGDPVKGLTSRDFTLTEDGQPQEIAFVEYEALETTPLAALAVPSGAGLASPMLRIPAASTVPPVTQEGVSVAVPGDVRYRGRRLMVLYFDLYRMPFFDELRAYENAGKYVATLMTPADLVAIMVFDGGGVRLKQEFTDDRVALAEAIRALMTAADDRNNGGGVTFDAGGKFGEDDDTFNIFTTDRQLAALQTAVTDLGPLPEVKTLVYFGSGLRLNGADNQAQLRATVNAAIRSNVTLNPIDTRGLVAAPPLGDATRASTGGVGMFSGATALASTMRQQQAQDTLYALAKDTGGRAEFDNNDLSRGIAEAARALTGYLIGYYTKNPARDGRYRRVKVALAGGLQADLSYRPGYYGDKVFAKFNAADKERQLAEALRLEDPITEIPMAMEVNYFQLNSAEYFVPVSVRMPGSELARPVAGKATHARIDLIGEVKDDHGVTMRNTKDLLEFTLDPASAADVARRPIQYETGFTLLPGEYVIKMLARDATTGRIGTYQRAFTIPNLDREAVALPTSSVVLTSQRVVPGDALYSVKQKIATDAVNPLVHDGQKLIPGVTRTFSASRDLYVFLQAYERGAATMRPIAAFVTFFREGAAAFEAAPVAIREGWDPTSKAVPIRFTIPPGTLAPGPYECQVTVLDPSGNRAAFWRAPIVVVR